MRDYLRWRYLAAALAIVLVGFLAIHSNHSSSAPAAAPPAAASTSPDSSASATPTTPAPTVSLTPSTGEPVDIANQFVAAWASRQPNEPAGPWVDRMRPYASPPLLDLLAMSAPGAIEAHQVEPGTYEIRSGQFGAQVVVPVDAGPDVLCGLANDGTRWLVSTVDPVEPDTS